MRGTSILLDVHDGWREESESGNLTARAYPSGARNLRQSNAALRRAEGELRNSKPRWKRARAPASSVGSRRPASEDHVPAIFAWAGTQAGGAASHINGFVNAALQLGVQVSLISNDEIAGLDQQKFPMKIIWPKPVGSTRAAFDIYNNLHFTERVAVGNQNEQPDFIYQRYARFSWAGVAAALRTKRPLFLEYNGSEVWVGRHWDRVDKLDLLARYERLNLDAAARIFVVSEVERQNLLQAGIEPEKIIVNPNGVDVDKFKPGIGGDEARRELGLTPDEIVVGFVGTFGPWHGV